MEESHSNCELFFYADCLANSKRTDYLSPSMNLCDQAMMGSRQCELTQPDASFLVCAIYDALKKLLQPSFVFLHLRQFLIINFLGRERIKKLPLEILNPGGPKPTYRHLRPFPQAPYGLRSPVGTCGLTSLNELTHHVEQQFFCRADLHCHRSGPSEQ